MAVNPPGLMLKRFQQAKKMHGTDSRITSSNDSTPMAEEVPPTVLHRFGGRPTAVAWGLQQMATMQPSGKDRNMILNQMDLAKNDEAIMRRIRKGWQAFGVDDPWWVVHDTPVRPMARYNSEPIISNGHLQET